jgi:hypothetical protein
MSAEIIPDNRPEDARLEAIADAIFAALAPLRHFHDNYDEGMVFDKYHEEAELALMQVVDKAYNDGYKDGAYDEGVCHAIQQEEEWQRQ